MFDLFLRIILVFSVLAAASLGQDKAPVSTETTELQTAECDCGDFLIVSEYDTVRAGDSVTFDLRSALQRPLPEYIQWSVSAGIIISGQGTQRITVLTTEDMLKPAVQPHKAIPSEKHGYIHSGGRGRVPFTVTASVVCDRSHLCPELTKSISVGRSSVKINVPADVTDLTLSTDLLVASCPPGQRPLAGTPNPSESMVIDVTTQAFDEDNDPLVYKYTVSGGEIIGKGANVKWDLSGALPGHYTINAAVDDGCGYCGNTISKAITVTECAPSCGLVECPQIDLLAPDNVTNLKNTVFTVNVVGGPEIKYAWSVENGEIISGQGTASITVGLPANATTNRASVTVKLLGLEPEGFCRDSATVVYLNGARQEDPK